MVATLVFLAATFSRQALVPSETTLSGYLAIHHWDAPKRGPMVVLEPDRVVANKVANGLGAFGRKEFRVGSITAIAPTEMVWIDTTLKEPPDLYDGLSRNDKILYLMSLLDSSQWKTACGIGIGLGDLRQDQRAVYRSILPSVFTYDNLVVGEGGRTRRPPLDQPQKATLTREEELGVRLRFFKTVEMCLRTQAGGIFFVSPPLVNWMRPGQPVLQREDNAAEDRTSVYGVQIRKVVDNRLKPSNLDYKLRSLDQPLALKPKMTIAEICKTASATSGLKLMADARIKSLSADAVGQSARTGDVLQSLALCITGTYRKVGDIYVLTADLEGIAAKRLRLAFWKWDVDTLVQKRNRDSKEKIWSTGYAGDVPFSPNIPRSNEAMTKFMESDRVTGSYKTMSANDLTPEWRQVITDFGQGGMAVRADVAEPTESVLWSFVLPDGRDLLPEGRDIGLLRDLLPRSLARPRPSIARSWKPIPLKVGSGSALVFKTDDPSVSERLPLIALTHGFEQVWIQTWNPACLTKAIEAAKPHKLPIRLMVKPWEVPRGTATTDPDVTLLGNTAQQAARLQEQTQWWLNDRSMFGLSPRDVGISFGPSAPLQSQIWRRLLDLCKTPGLSGSVVCQTEPPGYEPILGSDRSAPLQLALVGNLGFTQVLRSRFLAAWSVDPVDFVDKRLEIGRLDLSLPMFGDPRQISSQEINPVSEPYEYAGKWLDLLSEANRSAVAEWVTQIDGSVYLQPRATIQDLLPLSGYAVVPWQRSEDLPTTSIPPSEEESNGGADAYWVRPLGTPLDPDVAFRINQNLRRHIRQNVRSKLAVDLSSVPPSELAKQLDAWFVVGK